MTRLKRQGHPARSTARQRRKQWHDPDAKEAHIRELNRLVRKYQRSADDEDGDLDGLLRAAAEFAVPQLLNDFGLGEDHLYPLVHWLKAKFGDVLRDPEVDRYLAWRASASRKAASG